MSNLNNVRVGKSYILSTDAVASGASKVMLDLFNGTNSANKLIIAGIYVLPETDVAVTGAVSARFDVYRTSSAGTGGTASSYRSPSPAAINIAPLSSDAPSLLDQGITNDNVIPGIRARSAPTGGAAPKHWLFPYYAFTEETNAATILQQTQNIIPNLDGIEPLIIDRGEGLMIQQGAVASVNNFTFLVLFSLATVPSN